MNPPARKKPGEFLGASADDELAALKATVRDSQAGSDTSIDAFSDTASQRSINTGSQRDSETVSQSYMQSGREVVVTARVPSDLHKTVKRRIEDEMPDSGGLQAFMLGAYKAFLADPKTAAVIKKHMPARGKR